MSETSGAAVLEEDEEAPPANPEASALAFRTSVDRAASRAVLLALLLGLTTLMVSVGTAPGGGLQQSWGTEKDCTPDTAAAGEHWNRYWPGAWPLTVMVEPHTMRPSDT